LLAQGLNPKKKDLFDRSVFDLACLLPHHGPGLLRALGQHTCPPPPPPPPPQPKIAEESGGWLASHRYAGILKDQVAATLAKKVCFFCLKKKIGGKGEKKKRKKK
jgi:hypothetical protein